MQKKHKKGKEINYHSWKWTDVDLCPSTTLTNSQPLGKIPPTVQLVSGELGKMLVLKPENNTPAAPTLAAGELGKMLVLEFVASQGPVESGREFFAKGSDATKKNCPRFSVINKPTQ